MIRVLHFSDVHVQEPVLDMPAAELIGKRLLAAVNLWVKRGRLFRDAPRKLEVLAQFAVQEGIDFALCTGDFTALGSDAEHAEARRAIEPFTQLPLGFCTLPGNHDLYLADTLKDARFERHFGLLTRSDLPELSVDGAYPFVRLVGSELAVVGVNSAKPNPNPFSSAGHIPDAQLGALARALDDERMRARQVIVMTHYGVLRRDGHPDKKHHALDNADALTRVCARPRVMLVHGHIHWRYHHAPSEARPWLFCAGSATMREREGFWVYEVDGPRVTAIPGRYNQTRYELLPDQSVRVS